MLIILLYYVIGNQKAQKESREPKVVDKSADKNIREMYSNDTYIVEINNKMGFTFENIKSKTLEFYKDEGFNDKRIDTEKMYMIKNSENKSYIQIEKKSNLVKLSAHNTKRPEFIDKLEDSTSISISISPETEKKVENENTTSLNLVELVKMYEKKLLTDEEFKKLKSEL
jgi:hypothetical protein